MALLELQSVRAGYGVGPDILTDVSIDVEAGGTYVVIGPNGAGKSTMLKVISGLLTPRDGTVVFDGESIQGQNGNCRQWLQDARRMLRSLPIGVNAHRSNQVTDRLCSLRRVSGLQ